MKKALLSILTIAVFTFNTIAQYNQAFRSYTAITIPTPVGSNLLIQGSYTIEAWVHLIPVNNGTSPRYNIVESFGGSTGGYALRYDGVAYEFYKLNTASTYDLLTGSTHNISGAGPTNHVAVTYNHTNNELILYVDGVAEASMTTTMTNPVNQANMFIGGNGDNGSVNRSTYIDEVRIWEAVKTQT